MFFVFFAKGSEKVYNYEEKQGIIGDVKTQWYLTMPPFHTKVASPQHSLFLLMLFWWITAVPPLACEQGLRGVLAAGREKQVELTTAFLKFEFHLQFHCGSPSTKLSDFRQLAFCIDLFDADIQIRDTYLQTLLYFPSPPPEHPGELARRLYRHK